MKTIYIIDYSLTKRTIKDSGVAIAQEKTCVVSGLVTQDKVKDIIESLEEVKAN